MKWTPEKDELVLRLWKQGVSRAKIGERLGRSENSIIGRIYTLTGKRKEYDAARRAGANRVITKPFKPKVEIKAPWDPRCDPIPPQYAWFQDASLIES